GFTYLHDFIPDAGNDKNDRLKADYFIKKNINDNLRNTQTITSLGGDSTQTRQDKGSSRYSNTVQNFTARYDKNIKEKSFYAAIGFNANNSYNHETQQSSISASGQRLQSSNTQENEGYDDAKNFSFETGYNRPGSINGKRSMAFNVGYSFNAGADNNDRVNKTEFVSFNNLTQNKNINRHYTNSGNDVNQSLDLGLGDPIQYLFKNRVALWGVSVKPANNVYVTIHHENNEVEDRDSLSGNFIANPYLTGNSRYTLINDLPSLSFDKRFGKSLVNRYSKSLAINFTALAQFYYQKNTSSQLFQNITQNYKKFVPHASVSYMNNQFGYFQDYYKLNFSVSADYPNMSQLVPLVDSINLYYIQQGNNFLKPTNKKEVSFTMTHVSQRTKNEFNYGLNIGMGIVNNSFADSSNIDYLGRSTHKTININGYKYANAGGDIGKAFKFKNNQLQINMNTSFTLSETPSYINGIKNRSNDFRNNSFLSIYYTYLAGLAINLQEGYSAYRSRQNGASSRLFTYDNQYTKLSASVNCTKKLNISSNIAYNHSISNSSDAINFTIWNANAVYRFMQGNNLELKLSALDLLHQNTSIINFGSNNYITRGTVNVLRQYFMATVSYFPRQFRKKHSATDDE
ncbi:hypothetical protein, partial [Mucilaginibacter sp.]|uniref:hypothetical protein n=1 Tax=Mucilaginibacter sp. TaxID=1882438 RepID=UPI002ED3F68C